MSPSTVLHWISFACAFVACAAMAVLAIQAVCAALSAKKRHARARKPAAHGVLTGALCIAAAAHGLTASFSSDVDAAAVYAFGWLSALCAVAAFVVMGAHVRMPRTGALKAHYIPFALAIAFFLLHGAAAHASL